MMGKDQELEATLKEVLSVGEGGSSKSGESKCRREARQGGEGSERVVMSKMSLGFI